MSAQNSLFMFNTSFDPPTREEIEAARQAEQERQRAEEERLRALETQEEAPSFSEEELAAAKQESYDTGRQDAIREMEVHAEQILAVTQQSVASKLEQIFALQEQAVHTAERNTVELANVIVRKLFPTLVAEHGLPEVIAVVRNTLDQFREEPSVSIRVHPDYEESLIKATEEMAARGIFRGVVHIIGDPEVSPGDCRIEWEGGGAERNMARLFEELDTIVEKTLGMMDQFDGPYEVLARPEPTPPPDEEQAPPQAATPDEVLEGADNIDLFGDDDDEPASTPEPEAEALPDNIELFGDDEEEAPEEPMAETPSEPIEEGEPSAPSAEAQEDAIEMESTEDIAEEELTAQEQPAPIETDAAEENEPQTESEPAESDPSGVENG